MSSMMHKPSTAVALSKQQMLLIAIAIILTVIAIAYVSLYTFAHIDLLHVFMSVSPDVLFGHP